MSKGSAPVSGSAAAEGCLGTSGSWWNRKKPKHRASMLRFFLVSPSRGRPSKRTKKPKAESNWSEDWLVSDLFFEISWNVIISFDSIDSFFLPSAAKEKVTMIRWSPSWCCDVMCFHLGKRKETKKKDKNKDNNTSWRCPFSCPSSW